jgi:hypothetical protein
MTAVSIESVITARLIAAVSTHVAGNGKSKKQSLI